MLNYKQHGGKTTYCAVGKIILIRHNGVKNSRPLLSTDRTTQTHQLVTCRINGRNSRIRGKVVYNKTTELWILRGKSLGKSSFQTTHTIVESLLQQFSTVVSTRKSIDVDALRARGTRRREILALLDLLSLLVSASVETSPSPNSTVGTSIGPGNEQR